MRIIVTGGLGFIGSSFVNLLDNNTDFDILVVDKETYAANRDSISSEIEVLKKDICDVTPEDLGEYDYLVHFAAESHVDNSIKNGRPFLETNIMGTYNLVECARQNQKLKKFIHISTDEVYGDMWDRLVWNNASDENHKLNPSSYYSSTKAASDMIVMSAHRTFGFPYLITRTCNNYGEHQNKEKFLPTIFNSIKQGIPVPLYGDGTQEREWMYVEDNAKVIYDLMMDDEVINEVYNIGTGFVFKNINLITEISKVLDKEVEFKFVEDRLGHDKRYRLRCLKLMEYYKNKGVEYNPKKITDWFKEIL